MSHLTTRHSRWITPVFIFLSFYVVGAAVMDSFVVYNDWRFVGNTEFAQMHAESGKRIIALFVIPTLIMTVFCVLQFWHRPKIVSRKLVWGALICTVIPWLSSAFIQIPMQRKLSQGKNEALLEQLILTDWIRVIPGWGLGVIVLIMLARIVAAKPLA